MGGAGHHSLFLHTIMDAAVKGGLKSIGNTNMVRKNPPDVYSLTGLFVDVGR